MTVNRIGIMQGRLSPPQGGRLQFFPSGWQDEFAVAKRLGFDTIEWFADYQTDGSSSIGSWVAPRTRMEIERACQIIPVRSADCGRLSLHGQMHHRWLLSKFIKEAAGTVKTFCVPLLEESSIRTEFARSTVVKNLLGLISLLDECGVKIALEADVDANTLLDMLEAIPSDRVGVCYDLGNAASYGFDGPREIKLLGGNILEVHIKDRTRGGVSIPLGTGSVDFLGCFAALRDIDYRGDYVMQAWRGTNYLEDAKTQLAFVRSKLRET